MITAAEALAAIRALPLCPLQALLDHGPILVLAPHPDDESLGCGGLIAACCEAGSPPLVVIATDGAGSHPCSVAYPSARLRAIRMQEARDAVAELGLSPERLGFMGLVDTASPLNGPGLGAAVAHVVTLIERHGVRTILATWQHDPHCDHESAHHIAAGAATATGIGHKAYPVWGLTLPPATLLDCGTPTGFRLDITRQLSRKQRAIEAHRSQYAGLIDDDPTGFQLPPHFLALFSGPFETVLDVP